MIPILTAAESRNYDQQLIERWSIPSIALMERAAEGLFSVVDDQLKPWQTSQILIFCGTGNNGGDGIALARLLTDAGERPHVVIVGDPEKFSIDALVQYERLKSMSSSERIEFFTPSYEFARDLSANLIVVDALLGIGASGKVREPIGSAILYLNKLRASRDSHVIAVDIPSGLGPDSGQYEVTEEGLDLVVRADETVTIAAPKLGFFRDFSAEVVGTLRVIPLSNDADKQPTSQLRLIEKSDVVEAYPKRRRIRSKFDLGHVLSVCGSRGMSGAAILGAEAAMRSGCGLVTVATAESERATVARAMPELMTLGLPETETGSPTEASYEFLEPFIERATVLLIGSGMRPEEATAKLMLKLLRNVTKPIVVDAGALQALRGNLKLLQNPAGPRILTPHAGELAQMMSVERKVVEADRLGSATEFCKTNKVTLVMKGAPSYIVTGEGDVFVNPTGGVGLATAGSGDVLAGIIAGTLAQDASKPIVAAWIGSYLHGYAGDLAQKRFTSIAMTAREITKHLGKTYKALGLQ